jgi:hypothetical protein
MSTTQASDAERKAQSKVASAANITLLIGILSLVMGVFSLTLDPRVFDRLGAINLPKSMQSPEFSARGW